jgi:hypothetical protein
MLLKTLLARATGMPGFELWRGLAPRQFLIDELLADVIRATETLPISKADGTFAVISTSPLGLPETLPADWSEVARSGDHFAVFCAPVGTTSREVTETLALELIPLFYPSDIYEAKLFAWLEKELGPDDEEEEGAFVEGPEPVAPGPFSAFDIPSPDNYDNPKSEQEQDLDYLYGNGRVPPEHHRYQCTDRACPVSEFISKAHPVSEFAAMLDPTYGPPECHDTDVQQAENDRFQYC